MNRKQAILLVASIMIGLFWSFPSVLGGIPEDWEAGAGYFEVITIYATGAAGARISFDSNGTVDVFVTTTLTDRDEYMATGVIPSDSTVLGSQTGTSGELCVTYPDPLDTHFLVFGNKFGASPVGGTYEMDPSKCGIPGFGVIIVFFALLASFGILWAKRKLNF